MLNLTVQKFMTPQPHMIRHDQSLAVAHKLMRKHDIRHLPVLKDGRLAGILSQRDLYMTETLSDIDMSQVPVSNATSLDIYTVGPRASVRKVAEEMAIHKYGSAVVVDGESVVGIFTTVDALIALHAVLDAVLCSPELARSTPPAGAVPGRRTFRAIDAGSSRRTASEPPGRASNAELHVHAVSGLADRIDSEPK